MLEGTVDRGQRKHKVEGAERTVRVSELDKSYFPWLAVYIPHPLLAIYNLKLEFTALSSVGLR